MLSCLAPPSTAVAACLGCVEGLLQVDGGQDVEPLVLQAGHGAVQDLVVAGRDEDARVPVGHVIRRLPLRRPCTVGHAGACVTCSGVST